MCLVIELKEKAPAFTERQGQAVSVFWVGGDTAKSLEATLVRNADATAPSLGEITEEIIRRLKHRVPKSQL